MSLPDCFQHSAEVAQALFDKKAVVCLESSVWCQGLPRPFNLETAIEMEAQVRLAGAVPALLWLENGKIRCGAEEEDLQRLCQTQDAVKVGAGDIPGALRSDKIGATTVSASLALAELAGISVFATGGIGGVHRGWNQHLDISSDLHQLSRTKVLCVSAGPKSILDVPATLEAIESLAIPVITYRTNNFPHFYTVGEPAPFGTRCDEPEAIVEVYHHSIDVLDRAPMVVQSVPEEFALSAAEVDRWVEEGLAEASHRGIEGKELTPHLLGHVSTTSKGVTLHTNRSLLLHNAYLAGLISVELSKSAQNR